MALKTVREGGGNPTQRETQVAQTIVEEGARSANFRDSLFPPALAARFTEIRPLEQGSGESDCYILTGAEGTVFGKVYHRGKAPNVEVMARLGPAAVDQVVRRIAYAPAENGQRAWELLEYLPDGSLADLVAKEGPKLPALRVRQILAELVDALSHVHRLRVEHRDLKPGNVLIRSHAPFDLVLADFGIASAVDDTMRFTSGHQTQAYGPPEAYSGAVFKEKWDSWSLGMMLVEMLTGIHPLTTGAFDHSDELHQRRMKSVLAIGNPDDLVDGVEGDDWIKLCRGLLRRNPKVRWTTQDVQRWLADPADPALVIEEDRSSSIPPFRFRGEDYHTPPELAAALRADPARLTDLFQRSYPELLSWIGDRLGLIKMLEHLKGIQELDEPLDTRLMRLLQILDPSALPFYAGIELTPTAIGDLAEAALVNDGQAGLLNRLHEHDVLAKAAEMDGGGDLAETVAAWRDAIPSYERGGRSVVEQSNNSVSVPRPTGRVLTLLLAGATPFGGAADTVTALAVSAASDAARSCLWFQVLGEPGRSNPAGNVLIIQTASTAADQVEASEAARESRNLALWNDMGIGTIAGAGVGGVWWWAVSQWCTSGQKICVQGGWSERNVNAFDLVFLGCCIAAALALLVNVHQQTGRRL